MSSLPPGGGGSGWGGRGVDDRPIAWADAGSLLQPDSGAPSAAFLSVTPTPTLPLRGGGSSSRGGGSSSRRSRPVRIQFLEGAGGGGRRSARPLVIAGQSWRSPFWSS